jgi:serine/threonine protein kinase
VKRWNRRRLASVPEMVAFRKLVVTRAKLKHPNIALFFGACWEPPHVMTCMELFERGSVHDMLRDNAALTWMDPMLAWAQDVAMAMVHLHSHGVVHRGLTSANILVTPAFGVKVADFAEWAMADGAPCHWVAPEVLKGEEATPAADVYSFGILLAEMQTKADIYSNYAPHRVVHGVSAGALRPKLPPLMPPALVALAKDCWSGVPTFRLTAREVVERLHEPHLARPPSEEEMEAANRGPKGPVFPTVELEPRRSTKKKLSSHNLGEGLASKVSLPPPFPSCSPLPRSLLAFRPLTCAPCPASRVPRSVRSRRLGWFPLLLRVLPVSALRSWRTRCTCPGGRSPTRPARRGAGGGTPPAG